MRSNEFYEKIEDGFLVPTGEVSASIYKAPAPGTSLRDLYRDSSYAQRMAAKSTGENSARWQKIAEQAKARHLAEYDLPEHAAERELARQVSAAHNYFSMG